MKKTLSILAFAALAIGSAMTTAAKDVVVSADSSNSQGVAYGSLASAATLIDTATGGIIIYDESDDQDVIEAPFRITDGAATSSDLTVNLADVAIQEGDRLFIDFTSVGYGYQTWGSILTNGYDYLRVGIDGFADWYQANGPIEMVGRFKTSPDGSYIEARAFYIAEACDFNTNGSLTSQGSLLFFSEAVIDDVVAAEVPASSPSVPEPTTATLSLLALAGLAARRRRR